MVSILIPNYNKAPYLRGTLDSVLEQTYTNWECIIVDDHSTDDSWQILLEYSLMDLRFKIHKRPENLKKGGSVCRNYAFELSTGKYVSWFDSDDIMIINSLQIRLDEFKNFDCDIVIGGISNYKTFLHEKDVNLYNYVNPLNIYKGNSWIAVSMPLFKKEFFDKFCILFNPSLKRNQETEFFVRIFLLSPKVRFIPDAVFFWRINDSSITTKYQLLKGHEMRLVDFPAFLLIVKEFYKSDLWDISAKKYFKYKYYDFLTNMKFSAPEFFSLIVLGIKFGLDKNIVNAIYIIIKRFIKRILIQFK